MIENLTKENFWNGLHEKYPEAVEHFCKWIDDYKKEVNWDKLFASNEDNMQLHSSKYKFHEIPFDMQNGIIARYELELFNNGHGKGKEIYKGIAMSFRSQIAKIFEDLQKNIDKRKVLK